MTAQSPATASIESDFDHRSDPALK
ncbi:MAG: hypothetical protein JWP31_2144, partial [Aeromicrobium sp.]|nr:hypothetical protein [Aeromicrobium sp.]